MSSTKSGHEDFLRQTTGQQTVRDAVSWIAEGHPLHVTTSSDLRRLLRALVIVEGGDESRAARERVVRNLAQSSLDTAAVLFSLDGLRTPDDFRRALDALAWKSPTGSLQGLTAASVLNAQRAEPAVMATLCTIAGISTSNLNDWTDADLPAVSEGHWSLEQVREALGVIGRIVEGNETTALDSARPLRALELMYPHGSATGWEIVEQMRRGGVPYEILLAQREAGGAWLAHRNRTSGEISTVLAGELCDRLDDHNVDYLRSQRVGGTIRSTEVERVSGGSRSIGVAVRDDRQQPVAAVAFSVARDGGTARSSGSRLLKLRDSKVPIYVLLAGPGWADRNETADLAEAFEGEVYTDEHLDDLADELARKARGPRPELGEA